MRGSRLEQKSRCGWVIPRRWLKFDFIYILFYRYNFINPVTTFIKSLLHDPLTSDSDVTASELLENMK